MKKTILILLCAILLGSCGIYRPTDAKKVPVNADERIKKNMEEGRGFRLSNLGKSQGDFLFASSNPMWRATLEKLDFAPLGVVDYGGGVIITDWFGNEGSNDEIKITVKFLSNEIRSDGINVTMHKRKCKSFNNCEIIKINNSTNNEIKLAILKKAVEIKNQDLAKLKEDSGEYKIPGKKF